MMSLLYWLRVRQIAAGTNARLEERLAERNLVAQELHDTLMQGFLSASMQVHVARDLLPEDSPIKPILARSLELMGQVIEEGRSALRGLRSTSGVSLDLEDAFAQIQREFSREGANDRPVEFRLIVEGRKKPLNPLLRDEIYRIGREALTNAFRHARADHVQIELQHGFRDFRLVVVDDGCGVDPHILHAGQDGHRGLSGMRERADRMGAQVRLFSSPSAGTEVCLSVPGSIAYKDRPARRLSWFRYGRRSMGDRAPIQKRRTT
jgi:signal transduction histidine kinase